MMHRTLCSHQSVQLIEKYYFSTAPSAFWGGYMRGTGACRAWWYIWFGTKYETSRCTYDIRCGQGRERGVPPHTHLRPGAAGNGSRPGGRTRTACPYPGCHDGRGTERDGGVLDRDVRGTAGSFRPRCPFSQRTGTVLTYGSNLGPAGHPAVRSFDGTVP